MHNAPIEYGGNVRSSAPHGDPDARAAAITGLMNNDCLRQSLRCGARRLAAAWLSLNRGRPHMVTLTSVSDVP